MKNFIENNLPLYAISKKIKSKYFDENDNIFYNQMKNCNLVVTGLYTLGILFELV